MLEKSFIEKSRFALCMLLTVTGAYYGLNLQFNKATLSDVLSTKKAQAATLSVEMWWPADGARVQGVQPFKGLLQNTPVEQYSMYWKVDDGSQVKMESNYSDYPHKEASVDLTSWTWKGQGPYKITFVAKDNNNNTIAEKSVNIYNSAAQTSAPTQPAPAPAPTSTITTTQTVTTQPAVVTTISTPVATTSVQPAPTPAPTPVQTTVSANVSVWWPTNGATLSGSQPLKAVADGQTVETYNMYWQVDGGSLNNMPTNYADYPHKEVLVDFSGWNWKGAGPYVLTFVAKDQAGNVIGKKDVNIYTNQPASQNTSLVQTVTSPVTSTVPQTVSTVSSSVSNALSGLKLYVDPNSAAARQANEWRSYRSADASQIDKIAQQSQAVWLGNWNGDIYSAARDAVNAANSQGAVATIVAYNIPARDCGSYSAGGANSPEGYKSWIRSLKDGIGGNKAIVILEPDALPGITCLSQNDQNTRLALIKDAVAVLKSNGNTKVYIDAGHTGWVNESDMANRLKQAGIDQADGFSLNVSNYTPTSENVSYGSNISNQVGGKHFVIDTSRNGSGSNGEWCNPWGRSLGQKPTTSTGNSLVDAYLWIKHPGESDGTCNGGPSAGQWWADYALDIAKRTN